jgi:hypothetical protein
MPHKSAKLLGPFSQRGIFQRLFQHGEEFASP